MRALPISFLLVCLSACEAAAPSGSECILDPLAAQPRSRFPEGRTFYLPVLDTGAACAGLAWELREAPAGQANTIVVGADGEARFTPHVPGRHVFALTTGAAELVLDVIENEEVPYEDFAYYPSRSLARVDGEVWVANALVPEVTRLAAGDLEVRGTIAVGASPVALERAGDVVLVAQRASDEVGIVDVASGRIVDAVWVGDEPSNLVVSPDGAYAFVTLAAEDAIAVVDVAQRARVAHVPALRDPLGIALSADGTRLYVASHRSGQSGRYPFEADPVEAEIDLVVLDVSSPTSPSLVRDLLEVGTTIGSLLLSEDGATLYVANLVNDTEANLASPESRSFQHEILALDAATGEPIRRADLSRQSSSAGPAVTLHGMALESGLLWVAVEGSDLVIGLDPDTLEERVRVEAPGRPRAVLAVDGDVVVHGPQGPVVTRVAGSGEVVASVQPARDPRPALVAAGQRYFTGAGRAFAETWSCNSCHADARGDTLVWNAGPLEGRALSRPFFWLEGTYPLGWAGYLTDVRNYAYTVNTNVGVRPTTDEALALEAYISGLMPPPAGGATTRRDGSHSEAGLRGRDAFVRAGCEGCHSGSMLTSRAVFPEGLTPGVSDVPSLVGAYRHGSWMKRGESTTLAGAIELALGYTGVSLDASERADLETYLRELQARDFFVLALSPRPDTTTMGTDETIRITFSAPVWDDAENLARIVLRDAGGGEVEVARTVEASGRHVRVQPASALAAGARYTVVVDEALESFDGRRVTGAGELALTTAAAAELELEGRYVWTVDMPALDFAAGRFDPSVTTPTSVTMTVSTTSSGGLVSVDYGAGLTWDGRLVVDGDALILPALPVPIGPSFADTQGGRFTLVDVDADGRGDRAEGVITMAGPGFVVPDVRFRFEHESVFDGCAEGASGAVAIELGETDEDVTTFSWEGEAIAFYVVGPRATIPAGPTATVTGDTTYMALSTEMFPMGFAAPVTYGVIPAGAIDDGERHMATGEPLEPGGCYKVAVVTTRFQTGTRVFRLPE